MNSSKYLLFVIILLLVSTSVVFCKPNKIKQIDQFITQFVKNNQFSGEVLVSENGKVVYEKAFGLANADYKIPMRVFN